MRMFHFPTPINTVINFHKDLWFYEIYKCYNDWQISLQNTEQMQHHDQHSNKVEFAILTVILYYLNNDSFHWVERLKSLPRQHSSLHAHKEDTIATNLYMPV